MNKKARPGVSLWSRAALLLLHTLSFCLALGTRRNFLREGGMTFPYTWQKETPKRDREGEENNIRWWPGLTSRSHQWESSDELHQSSWYRCNQRSESGVYKMAAELPEEEHKTHMVRSCSQASLEMHMYNSHSSRVFKCLTIVGDYPNWIFILPWL